MIRWVSVSLGLAIAALAFYLLLRGEGPAPPMDDIDAESRTRLEQVLPEAEGGSLP